jgi:hypothetical protein
MTVSSKANYTHWGAGPWDDEPDCFRGSWDIHPEFEYEIKRVRESGHLCGYVHVPSQLVENRRKQLDGYDYIEVDGAHGGITFENNSDTPGYTKIGFDCAHAWDIRPGSDYRPSDATYRTWDYVLSCLHKMLMDFYIQQQEEAAFHGV